MKRSSKRFTPIAVRRTIRGNQLGLAIALITLAYFGPGVIMSTTSNFKAPRALPQTSVIVKPSSNDEGGHKQGITNVMTLVMACDYI